MTTPKTIKKAILFLTPEQLGYIKSCSALIAIYKRINNKEWEESARGKLQGYLTCLMHLHIISYEDCYYLNNWFSSADRSKEETE